MAKKTREELEAMLAEQIDYLESSAHLYDLGRKHEAKRLAVTIRVLVHDTSMSRSLMGQLDLKSKWAFLDSAGNVNLRNLLSLTPLLAMEVTHLGEGRMETTYIPHLADDPFDRAHWRALSFDDWWSQLVVRDTAGEVFTRRDLILYLANKVGGAHVDATTQPRLDALRRSETLGWYVGDVDGERRVDDDPILPCVRQIAFEVLETLRAKNQAPPPLTPAAADA